MNNLKAYFKDDPDFKSLQDVPVQEALDKLPPGARSGGHGASEYYMIEDFLRSILDDAKPAIDVYDGLDYTVPGICAQVSSERGGELVEVPNFR